MAGWIKLHRSIQEHWIYTEKRKFSKFEAWNDILLTVNFTEGKTIIKGKLIQIKRGESILSLDSWAKRWGWDKSAVRRFLNTLQKDNMIELKNETITTRLIVCKYDTYQDERNADETQMKRKRNADETHLTPIEEGKEEKEGKELFLLEKETKEENLSKENPNEIFPETESVETGAEERKKVAPKKERNEEKLTMPDDFIEIWEEWKEYRKAKRFKSYAGLKWEQMAVDKLLELSNKNPTIAKLILKQTYENSYQGFFPLKQNSNGITNTTQSGFSTSKPSTNNGNSGKRSYRQILAERLTNELKANGEGSNITIDAEICE